MGQLQTLYEDATSHYQSDQGIIQKVVNTGQEANQIAALSIVANTILNLDSFIMKE